MIQHLINVIAVVILRPVYGLFIAFGASLLRNILGSGSLLAFPGSMVGALLAYPLATLVLRKEVAVFAYLVPFSISSGVGSIIAYIVLQIKAIRSLLLSEHLNLQHNNVNLTKKTG